MPDPITNGALLVNALRLSGTGDRHLAPARKVLTDAPDPGAVTAAQVVEALEANPAVPEVTRHKARSLAAVGEVRAPASPLSVEDRILAGLGITPPKAPEPGKADAKPADPTPPGPQPPADPPKAPTPPGPQPERKK